ncbi:MAG: hypothetical protein HPY55_04290 [Firmicutes bacterium]|nr:hypothetical protein [Bacillota bacterium]
MDWKQRILELTGKFQHPAWGPAHSGRVYDVALDVAAGEDMSVDADVLFAAAFLHDNRSVRAIQGTGG